MPPDAPETPLRHWDLASQLPSSTFQAVVHCSQHPLLARSDLDASEAHPDPTPDEQSADAAADNLENMFPSRISNRCAAASTVPVAEVEPTAANSAPDRLALQYSSETDADDGLIHSSHFASPNSFTALQSATPSAQQQQPASHSASHVHQKHPAVPKEPFPSSHHRPGFTVVRKAVRIKQPSLATKFQ